MTGKTVTLTQTAGKSKAFPEFPPREDMQNVIHLYKRDILTALSDYLADANNTTVMSETPLGRSLNTRGEIRIPDLLVSRNSDPARVEVERGYSIESQGKPPDFVLEVASHTTGIVDYTEKRADYERFAVSEYWRFDPSGGEYHDAPLAGDRLVNGRYEPIEIEWTGGNDCRGYSDALGLYLCWEDGILRLYEAETESYLRTLGEETAARQAESRRADREAAARRLAEAEVRRLRERLSELGDS